MKFHGILLLMIAVCLPVLAQSVEELEYIRKVRNRLQRELQHLQTQQYRQEGLETIEAVGSTNSKRVPIQLAAATTYAIIGACDQDCDHVQIALFDESEQRLIQSPEQQPIVIIHGTPTVAGSFMVEVSVPGCKTKTCHAGILIARLGPGGEAPTPPEPKPPTQEEVVRPLQRELKRVGCDPGDIDGQWGDQTRAALAAFARKTGAHITTDRPTAAALHAVSTATATVCPPTTGADGHWVVGRWKGEVSGLNDRRIGDTRTLIVTRVLADGTVAGRWADGTGRGGDGTRFVLSGNRLTITTTYDNRVTLEQTAPGQLTGSFLQTKTGIRFRVMMQRQ